MKNNLEALKCLMLFKSYGTLPKWKTNLLSTVTWMNLSFLIYQILNIWI